MVRKKKNRGGRPTICTPETVHKLETAFALGCTDHEACLFANISPATLYNYQNDNPQFLDRKQALKESPILKARTELVKGLEGNPELALKFLERKKRDEFALKTEIDQATVVVQITKQDSDL
jgi:hypothetical protein